MKPQVNTRVKVLIVDNFIWFINAGLYILFIILNPRGFLTIHNVEFILYVSSMLGFLVLGEALAMITGGMDLSLAQNAGLSAMVGGFILGVMAPSLPGWLGVIIVLIAGTAFGAVNGLLVGKLKYNPFLATLGTFIVFDWATFWIRRGAIVNLPASFLAPGSGTIGGVHIAIFLFLFMALLLHLMLRYTQFGVSVYAVGDNPKAAMMMGINVGKVLFGVFTLGGLLAGFSGLIYLGYIGAVTSLIAQNKIFEAFAGAVLGGVSLRGGRGSIMGALGGVILLGILDAGLTMLNVSPEIRGVLTGFVLLVAVMINMAISRLRDRILMPH
ncbi:ABC transporter permease [Candidatus Bipolaricaulota bacterium]|nr:ABC transporter permease [Candidatus Bipolaricaulota bacterium]